MSERLSNAFKLTSFSKKAKRWVVGNFKCTRTDAIYENNSDLGLAVTIREQRAVVVNSFYNDLYMVLLLPLDES